MLGAAEAGHVVAGRWLLEEHGASGEVSVTSDDGTERVARAVGAASSDAAARGFFSSLGVFLGRYALSGQGASGKDGAAALHVSATSEVRYAVDLVTQRDVCIKSMKNR